jgi:hypothetical protein
MGLQIIHLIMSMPSVRERDAGLVAVGSRGAGQCYAGNGSGIIDAR